MRSSKNASFTKLLVHRIPGMVVAFSDAMKSTKPVIVVLEPEPLMWASWAEEASNLGLTSLLCATVEVAEMTLISRDVDVFVTPFSTASKSCLTAIRVAREKNPPVQVVVLTNEPTRARVELREHGLVAEILVRPMNPSLLADRLGLTQYNSNSRNY